MPQKLNVLLISSRVPNLWEQEEINNILGLVAQNHNLTRFDLDNPPHGQFEGVDVVIDLSGPKAKREWADLASSIKLWQLVSTGFDSFDLNYWQKKGIPTANTPGTSSAIALAENALMFMIMLSRCWHETQIHLDKSIVGIPIGTELKNRRLGLIGFGASATALARRAMNFSMKISAIDIRQVSQEEQKELGVDFFGGPNELDEVLSHSDFISLHLHLNQDTHHLMNDTKFRLMKPTAFLINVARGALVDESALYTALTEKRLAGAGLDVFSKEPIDPKSPLLLLPNVIATPHTAGQTDGTLENRINMVVENLNRVACGLEPIYRIDQ